ncbi:MAG TPA: AEC family transporter [Methanocorpusculum sp.]|nr:AEC family transporter [Methanocorpusculum sp.]
MEFSSVIDMVLTLLMIIGIGYAARKYHILSKESVSSISKFVLFVSLPALILVSSTSKPFTSDCFNILFILLLSSAVYYLLSIAASLIIPRLLRSKPKEIGIYRFILVFPSAVFFAFPIVEMLYGKEGILYAAIFNLPYFLLTFTLGILLMTSALENKEKVFKFDPKIFLNLAFLATLIGLLLFIFSISIPEPFHETLSLLGKTSTPLALIATGGFLFEVDLLALFQNYRHYLMAIARLVVLPIIVYAALSALIPLFSTEVLHLVPSPEMQIIQNMILAVAVIIAAMPAAVQTVIIASEYKAYPEVAAEIILVTTILATVTVPLLFFMGFIPF